MDVLARYEVYVCPDCGRQGSPATLCLHGADGPSRSRERVEVVRADAYQGAVSLTDAEADALDRLLDAYIGTTTETDEWVPHLESIRSKLLARGR